MIKATEKKIFIQSKKLSKFDRQMNTVAYSQQRALINHKPKTLVVIVEKREKARSIIFNLLQLEQSSDEMKSPKANRGIN